MSSDTTTPMDLARAMILAAQERDWTMIVLSAALILVVGFWVIGVTAGIVTELRDERRARQASRRLAMLRHPSARTAQSVMTPEEFQYHTSRQWGR